MGMAQQARHAVRRLEGSVVLQEDSFPETLRLRIEPRQPERRHVTWDKDVHDNEDEEKFKSKSCCIYHRPHAWDESSDESDGDDIHKANKEEREREREREHKRQISIKRFQFRYSPDDCIECPASSDQVPSSPLPPNIDPSSPT